MFTYMSTGENYTELVYPLFDVSPWYIIFFCSFTIFGMFLVMAVVISFFQKEFKARFEIWLRDCSCSVQDMRERMEARVQLYSRTGMVAAFVLLDRDGRCAAAVSLVNADHLCLCSGGLELSEMKASDKGVSSDVIVRCRSSC